MNEERLNRLKSIVNLDYENRHDNPQMYFTWADLKWLTEQAETLQKIANRWVEIETNGTYEEANDFYTFVQDTLSPKQMD